MLGYSGLTRSARSEFACLALLTLSAHSGIITVFVFMTLSSLSLSADFRSRTSALVCCSRKSISFIGLSFLPRYLSGL